MEYPKLKDQTEKDLSKLDVEITNVRRKLEKALDILHKHKLAITNKQRFYHRYLELKEEDPRAADELYEKKKLGISLDRKRNKEAEIEILEQTLQELVELQGRLRIDLKILPDFSPIEDQFDLIKSEFSWVTKKEWNRQPNSKFKTFQNIFGPAGRRILPKQGGIYDGEHGDNIPLDICVLDPRYVRDWFLEEFDLADLPDDLTRLEKMRVKASLKPQIAELFEHSNPMSPYGSGGDKKNYRLLVVEDYDSTHDGKIIAPFYLGRISRDPDKKAIQVFDNAYSAHRKGEYIEKGYTKERGKIFGMKRRVESIRRNIQGMKANDPRRPEVEDALAAIVVELEQVTNFYKHEAYDIFKKVRQIKDKRDKHNPGATCAQIVKALSLLEERMPQIFEKSKAMHEDKETLSVHIQDGKSVLDQCFYDFKDICGLVYDTQKAEAHGPLFGNGVEKGDIEKRLERLPDIDSLKIRPFNQYGAKLAEKVELIKKAMQEDNQETVRNESVKAFVICKIFHIQHEREKILRDISLVPEETSVDFLLGMARRLQSVTEAREVFPDVQVGYHGVYENLQERVKGLTRGLQHYDKQVLSQDEKREMYTRLKEYLEEIDFSAILEQLD